MARDIPQTVFAGTPAVLGPISIADANAGNGPLTVVISDTAGALSATASGAGTVGGAGSHKLTLTGGLADLNAELAGLTYSAASAGSDTVAVNATGANNASVTQSIAVTTDAVPQTTPVLNAPATTVLISGQPSGIGGISISDPYAEATGQQVTLNITSGATPATFTVSGGPGGTVTGQGTGDLTITSTVQQINSYLSDGWCCLSR